MLLFLGLSAMSVRKKYYPFAIPSAFLFIQLLPILYFYLINDYDLNNISIRALTQMQIIENLSLLGDGIASPIETYLSENHFSHYFVPADAFFLGSIYETGLLPYLIKLLFAIYIILTSNNIKNCSLFWMGMSFFLFGYGLTFDIVILVFSLFTISLIPRFANSTKNNN